MTTSPPLELQAGVSAGLLHTSSEPIIRDRSSGSGSAGSGVCRVRGRPGPGRQSPGLQGPGSAGSGVCGVRARPVQQDLEHSSAPPPSPPQSSLIHLLLAVGGQLELRSGLAYPIPGVPWVERMAGAFAYESSKVDWCEDNYRHSEHVVEYFNTVSNLIFFLVSPIMLYLLHPYARERNLAVHLVWVLMIFVGLFSGYFHMTLSFMGQMLDELSILWVQAVGYALWFPQRLFPAFVKDRRTFSRMVLAVAVLTTVSSFVKPTANAYVLNIFGVQLLYMLRMEMKRCTDQKATRLAKRLVCLWLLAIACWISDRFGCSFWQKLDFCYLHGFWHILIVMATAYGTTLIAYLDATYEIPSSLPELRYWPCDRWEVGFPHIVLRGDTKSRKGC
ncbi:Alkaline ceramidase 1 [Merluccius polli]|uniref:Alkaline ceramidase n=1 Tax=Merluccius polli TaxID=89951 RepID=A0AA47P456_MERPO|nr:Alkaline ceramidase 1 [Merluccius polli]